MEIYVVQEGDSVDSIAQTQGVSAESIIYVNQLVFPYELAIGQALLLQKGEREPGRSITVNGYAYPFIGEWTLAQTLPYLTSLSVFSYGFTEQGELLTPAVDDTWMIALALEAYVNPVLTLTPFGPDGRFSNALIHSVINSEAFTGRLTEELLETMTRKRFSGIDIDFEYILAEDRDAFSAFVRRLSEVMNGAGFFVSVALAPKVAADQPGLLYEGKDYRALGDAADSVLLMTYEWGYTYGPNMAVAPIHKVRQVVDYAVTEIEPAKIDLGIPNYGYDWPLPYERGVTKARTIGNVEAVRIAVENSAQIRFDETAQSPFFRYVKDGVEHEVWFEDVRSLEAKFGLITEYGLRGAGYWQIMQYFRANWFLLHDMFQTIP